MNRTLQAADGWIGSMKIPNASQSTAKLAAPDLIPQPKSVKLDPKGRVFELHLDDQACGPECHDVHVDEFIFDLDEKLPEQAYRIQIDSDGIKFSFSSDEGLHYAGLTFGQLAMNYEDPR